MVHNNKVDKLLKGHSNGTSSINPSLCSVCKGRGFCGKPCPILKSIKAYTSNIKDELYGTTPPEIFVGRYNYPNVYSGLLSPDEISDTSMLSKPELWFKSKVTINDILQFRSRLIYSRIKINVKSKSKENRTTNQLQELAAAYKPTTVDIKLKKKPRIKLNFDSITSAIINPAPLKSLSIEGNTKIKPKVDSLINDNIKASDAIIELYQDRIEVSNIQQILSAGLLGLKHQRKFVPTRWGITATDDIISKHLLQYVKDYPPINDYLLFNATYLGNHYEVLLLPSVYSFEVVEAKMPGSVWNQSQQLFVAQDYEGFYGRKTYAGSVTGAYYANRLALTEYLMSIKRQASCLVIREVRPEYWAPCGVGILRETIREAFSKKPERFSVMTDAFKRMQQRLKLDVSVFKQKSWLIKNFRQQKRLSDFI